MGGGGGWPIDKELKGKEREREKGREEGWAERERVGVSNLVFYTQSTITTIHGKYREQE